MASMDASVGTDIDLASNRFRDIGENVNKYWYIIRQYINCSHLVYMPGFSSSKRIHEIVELNSQRKHLEAADIFLEELKNLDDPGKWESFLMDLKDHGYEYMANIVEGTVLPDAESAEAYKRLVTEVFGKTIRGKLYLMPLLPAIYSAGLINQQDKENLQAKNEREGNITATDHLLLSLIWRMKKNWLDIFLKVLIENEEEELARLIDDTKYWKIKCQLQERGQRGLTSAREDVMHGEGSAHLANPNFSPPSASGGSETPLGFISEAENDERTRLKELAEEGDEPELPPPVDHDTQAKQVDDGEEIYGRAIQETGGDGPMSFAGAPRQSAQYEINDVNRNISVQKPDLEDKLTEFNDLSLSSAGDRSNEESGLMSGNDSMEEEPMEAEGTEMVLRPYQTELARSALLGKNVIICAPTGSGKTIVALKIILEHLRNPRPGQMSKVAFLVDQVALADQQYRQCLKFLPRHTRVKKICGDSMRNSQVPLKNLLERVDVLVMTAQILVDALRSKAVPGVQAFSLLVFDECHHTISRHPYNQIMCSYLDQLKLAPSPRLDLLPQVVGLTASVGVGKAKDKEKAKEHILKLCANLDAEKVETVRENRQALAEQSNVPVLDVQTVRKRENDKFRDLVEKIMGKIETDMRDSPYLAQAPRVQPVMRTLPASRGGDQYIQWLSGMRRPVAQTSVQDPKRYFRACIMHLEIYNTALNINNDCRTKDAVDYLVVEMEGVRQRSRVGGNTKEEADLLQLFERHQRELQESDVDSQNPKLEKLKKMIRNAFIEEPESRAIVFAKTRDLVKALVSWMNDDNDLRRLRPAPFTGAQASTEKGGMTKHQQVDVLEYFKAGDHKVIVATSVAEEGLDIRKCNLVVRYLHVTNEIAMMQARGRARAEDSKFAVVAAADSGMAEKEELNLMREMLMKRALDELHQENPADIRKRIANFQEEAKTERDLEALSRRGRQQNDGEYTLMCLHCDAFACMNSDIRKIQDSHHVVITEDFKESVREVPHPKPTTYGDFSKVGKIACKNCGFDWGILAIYKSGKFPVIKIESFVYEDCRGVRDTRKKWKQIPFKVQQLSNQDLRDIITRTRMTLDA